MTRWKVRERRKKFAEQISGMCFLQRAMFVSSGKKAVKNIFTEKEQKVIVVTPDAGQSKVFGKDRRNDKLL